MENLRTTLLSAVALVIVLALLGTSVVVAPHLLVLVMSLAAMTYIGGMVFLTLGK
ncbi:hypothetical protein [Azospirillum sp.]|uniref:hypothetical protein n=1 Tax=Azospirillum sp. TaxID=34012 RepID=UPI003D74B7DC